MINNSAITRNVLVIGNNVTKRAADYFKKVHGKEVGIMLLDPTSEKFTSRDGLKKFIDSKDETVYILKGEISEKEMLYARNGGTHFVELEQDHHGNVTGFWTNVMPDRQVYTISTDKEIEAFKVCGLLAGAVG